MVLNKVAAGTGNFCYNAATGEYGDMVAFGVLDPPKVVRTALQNAGSIPEGGRVDNADGLASRSLRTPDRAVSRVPC